MVIKFMAQKISDFWVFFIQFFGFLEAKTLSEFFIIIVNIFDFLAGGFFLFFMIYGGVKWIKSIGDAQKVGEAKQIIIKAVLGILIVIVFYIFLVFLNFKSNFLSK